MQNKSPCPDKSSRSPSRPVFSACFALLGLVLAPRAQVVISQVYGGGGNSGATLTHDFVELHNRSADPVDITGWSVQYAPATGSAWKRTRLAGTLPPGGYYLVQQAPGTGGTAALPAPDAIGSIVLSGNSGKVALVAADVSLTGACPGKSILDLVGYGPANCFEGASAVPALSTVTAALRADAGCIDAGGNGSDFSPGNPAPRNSASPAYVCPADYPPRIVSVLPAPGAANARPADDVTLRFDEPVDVGEGWFTLAGSTSGIHPARVSGGPTAYRLDPEVDFLPGETVTVRVRAHLVSDQDGIDPPDHPAADSAYVFRVVFPARIAGIQGRRHRSPWEGLGVVDVPGIVTALRKDGFYLQDPSPDADPATSEGIFVFTGSPPGVLPGDAVEVDGKVTEYRPGGAGGVANLTQTELTGVAVRILASGQDLPSPITMGKGGRPAPSKIIDAGAAGDVETSGTFDPDCDGIDFFESLEAMRVRIPDPAVVGPTTASGEFVVVADGSAAKGGGGEAGRRTPRGGVKLRRGDFNPERILVDDAFLPIPSVKVGDGFAGSIVGILDYRSGNFRVSATELPPARDGGLAPEYSRHSCGGLLSVATFNVENLDPLDPPEKFARLASIIVTNLRSPLLIALEEVQDNNGPVKDSLVEASETFARLIAAIEAAGGPHYDYRSIAPQAGRDGGEPGGNIRTGFLFQPDKDLIFMDRPGGTAVDPVEVVSSPEGPRLNFSPGRVDPLNPAFAGSRKPLAAEFQFRGKTYFVIANHFNSKGGDQPLFGRFQPPARPSEVQRTLQAAAVHRFAASLLAADPGARLIVLGDFNDFEFSGALSMLQGGILHNLMDKLPRPERYGYVFEGNSQALDHILVSRSLARDPGTWYDIVHVNAEFPGAASDHDPQRACFHGDGESAGILPPGMGREHLSGFDPIPLVESGVPAKAPWGPSESKAEWSFPDAPQ